MPPAPAMAEIREADAPAEIAAIYADIRQATALPQVNLIFRHLATRPGVLEWVWHTLRPLYLSQEMADAAAALSRSVPAAGAPSPIPAALSNDAHHICRLVLDTYDSGNTQNLIALTTFVRLLDGGEPDGRSHLTPRTAEAIGENDARRAAPFPPIPRRSDLPADITAQLEHLATRHHSAPGVIPSLYIHLTLWPNILPAIDAFLEPRLATPDWRKHVEDLIEVASETADRLAPHLAQAPAPDITIQDRTVMAETIRTFVNATIPEMVIIGRWLTWDSNTI